MNGKELQVSAILLSHRKKRGNAKVIVPKEFIGDESTMYEEFIRCADKCGDRKEYAIQLLKLLPKSIKEGWVWFDRVAQLWRYEYGLPYDELPQNTIISGTNVHLPVDELYSALKIADKRLTREQLLSYLQRLSDKAKHSDVVFEMRPMKNIKDSLSTNYEVSGFGRGNTTLDWQVKGRFINIVFDVKNRTKSIIDDMKKIIPDLNRGTNYISPPAPNPEDLFKSTQNKLEERCYLSQLQGVWVHTDIKEDEMKLRLYFKKTLNKRKVHFAILSDWKEDAFILARNRVIAKALKRIFCLTESGRFVTREYT
jgi:hypothetical protein